MNGNPNVQAPIPDTIRGPIPQPTGALKKPKDDVVQDRTTSKVTFTREEVDIIMSSLQTDEEVLLAAKVKNGMEKLKLLEDYLDLKQNDQNENY